MSRKRKLEVGNLHPRKAAKLSDPSFLRGPGSIGLSNNRAPKLHLLKGNTSSFRLGCHVLSISQDARFHTLTEDRSRGERKLLLCAMAPRNSECGGMAALKGLTSQARSDTSRKVPPASWTGKGRVSDSPFASPSNHSVGVQARDSERSNRTDDRNIMRSISMILGGYQSRDGWRSTISTHERTGTIINLYRLYYVLDRVITNNQPFPLDSALAFERKKFLQSDSRVDYNRSVSLKLSQLQKQVPQHLRAATRPTTATPAPKTDSATNSTTTASLTPTINATQQIQLIGEPMASIQRQMGQLQPQFQGKVGSPALRQGLSPQQMQQLQMQRQRLHLQEQVDQALLGEVNQYLDDQPQILQSEKPPAPVVTSYWSVPELALFRQLVARYGRDYALIADFMKTKSQQMIKNHYSRELSKGDLELDKLAQTVEDTIARGRSI